MTRELTNNDLLNAFVANRAVRQTTLSAFLAGTTIETVAKQTANHLNMDQLVNLSDVLTNLCRFNTGGINLRFPNTAPQGSWFLKESNSASRIAMDRMIYIQAMRLRDSAADMVCFSTLDKWQMQGVANTVRTLTWLHAQMIENSDDDDPSNTANNSVGRAIKSAAAGTKTASDAQKEAIYKQMVTFLTTEYPEGEVRLYESCLESPKNALVSEVQRYNALERYLNGLDSLAISRIDAAKRPEQVTVATAKALCVANMAILTEAVDFLSNVDLEDPIKCRTTDPIDEALPPADDSGDDAARREAYDKHLSEELNAAFGGVFADHPHGGTLPPMH